MGRKKVRLFKTKKKEEKKVPMAIKLEGGGGGLNGLAIREGKIKSFKAVPSANEY